MHPIYFYSFIWGLGLDPLAIQWPTIQVPKILGRDKWIGMIKCPKVFSFSFWPGQQFGMAKSPIILLNIEVFKK